MLSGKALREPVGTKTQQVAFGRRRNWSPNFTTNLCKAFVKAHKVAGRVEVQPSSGDDTLGALRPPAARARARARVVPAPVRGRDAPMADAVRMIAVAFRAERFSSGAVNTACEDGTLTAAFDRLRARSATRD